MKNIVFFITILCFGIFECQSQVAPSKYFVQFTDKNNSPYNLSNPLDFLSQKSIDRRTNQGYTLDDSDLPVNFWYIDSVANAGNVVLLNKTKWFNGVTIFTLDTNALNKINAFPFVQNVLPVAQKTVKNDFLNQNYQYLKTSKQTYFKDSSAPYQKNSKNTYNYGFSANQIEMIGLDYMHNQGYNGNNMTIAVLDAGFYNVDTMSVFDSLRNANRILGTCDFVEPCGNVYQSHTHGMMVLSLMAANVPGQLIGTAPQAAYWLLRSEDGPTEYIIEEYNWLSAAEYADSVGADIINSSLGYYEFDDPAQNHVFEDFDGKTIVVSIAANMASSKGILVVNSAGNSAQTPWQRIIAPADADSVLAVGAVNENENYASFSSVGNTFDGRIKPDVAAQGANTVVASAQGGIMTGNGTSFSSPIIAGAVACLWQAHPTATNMQIIDAVKQSSHQYNSPDSLLGYGIPNFGVAHMLLNGVTVNEAIKNEFITVFPNPFNDYFTIVLFASDTQTIDIELFNFNGNAVFALTKIITHKGYNNILCDIFNNVGKGMYILKVTTNNQSVIRKLVKIS